LAALGFTEYFSAQASDGPIKDGIQPPANAKEIFMGCGLIDSEVLKMGVFGFPEELFDQRSYQYCVGTNAKSVRGYHAYYSTTQNEPIGFSKGSTVNTPFLG